jgi:Arc/MetJ-type ribon-helix-helix transcriptional regulator
MSLTIPKEAEQFVQSEVSAGIVGSTDDVIMQALELYQLRKQYIEGRIEKGIEDVKAGRVEEFGPQFLDDIKQGALKKIAARKSQR